MESSYQLGSGADGTAWVSSPTAVEELISYEGLRSGIAACSLSLLGRWLPPVPNEEASA